MGIYSALEQRATWPPGPTDDFWFRSAPSMGGAGVKVSADNATGLTAVYRAVSLLAGTMGMLPAKVFRELPDGTKEPLRTHPAYKLLRWEPNSWQTAFEWYEMMQTHLELRGNAFSRVERDAVGNPTALIPWHPDRIRISVMGSRLVYTLTKADGTTFSVPQEDMLHVKLAGNGIIGFSPIALMAESLGVGFAAQSYGARFFGNDSRPGGVLEHPGQLSKEARQNLESTWTKAHAGANQHSIAVLEDGVTFNPISIAPEEAQFLQTRNFQIDEVSRMFGPPPHLLHQNERSTFSNVEHLSGEFKTFTMQPRLVRWEQAIKRILFPGEEDVFVEFLMDAMLRADTKTRAEANAIRFMNGNLNADEWRRMENQNPIGKAAGGETFFVPLNLSPLDQVAGGLEPPPIDVPPDEEDDRTLLPPSSDRVHLLTHGAKPLMVERLREPQVRSAASRHRQMRAFRKLFRSVSGKVVRRDVDQVRRAVKVSTDKPELLGRIAEMYDGFATVVSRELHPALRTYAEVIFGIAVGEVSSSVEWGADEDQFMKQYADNVGDRYTVSSERQLEKLVTDAPDIETASALVEERVSEWEVKRAGKMADRESVQANGAISRFAYTVAGVTTFVWVTIGANCPLCDSLDGKVVGVQENFVDAGDTVTGAGAAPLTPRRNVGHAPLHDGCDCLVVAG